MGDAGPDQDLDDALADEDSVFGDAPPSDAGSVRQMEEDDDAAGPAAVAAGEARERAVRDQQRLERERLAQLEDERRRSEVEVARQRERQLGGSSGVHDFGSASDNDRPQHDDSDDDQMGSSAPETEAERAYRKWNPQGGSAGVPGVAGMAGMHNRDARSPPPAQHGRDDDSVDGSSMDGDGPATRSAQRATLFSGSDGDAIRRKLCNADVLAPVFPHHKPSNGGWMEFTDVFSEAPNDEHAAAAAAAGDDEVRAMRPARAMCYNLPKSMFRPDADRLRDMRSNMHNQSRATNMNALFGLLWTPVAKGWK